jgi:hypothetical protein
MESEGEWAQNKSIVDLKNKPIRNSVFFSTKIQFKKESFNSLVVITSRFRVTCLIFVCSSA